MIFAVIGAVSGLLVGTLQAKLMQTALRTAKFSGKVMMYIAKLILWAAPMVVLAVFFGIWPVIAFALTAGPMFLILSLIMLKKSK